MRNLLTGRNAVIVAVIGLIAMASFVIVFYIQGTQEPVFEDIFEVVEEPEESEIPDITIAAPVSEEWEIEISRPAAEMPALIPDPEPEIEKPEEITYTDENGVTVQSPNWQAQKEFVEGTVLDDNDETPQYQYENSTQESSAQPDTTINGVEYGYFPGFGYVQKGDGNEQRIVDIELSGEKAGY